MHQSKLMLKRSLRRLYVAQELCLMTHIEEAAACHRRMEEDTLNKKMGCDLNGRVAALTSTLEC